MEYLWQLLKAIICQDNNQIKLVQLINYSEKGI